MVSSITVPSRRLPLAPWLLAAVLVAVLGACAGAVPSPAPSNGAPGDAASTGSAAALVERLDAIDAAVGRWRSADSLVVAQRAAEEARNLVVGPAGPFYGDADGDGTIGGASPVGVLPGTGGESGLATDDPGACVVRDVLGGDWSDPAGRWAILEAAIDAWSPSNNPFPTLPSHPQRIVGWATLTLRATDLADALEFGGHAKLHVDVSLRAIKDCGG